MDVQASLLAYLMLTASITTNKTVLTVNTGNKFEKLNKGGLKSKVVIAFLALDKTSYCFFGENAYIFLFSNLISLFVQFLLFFGRVAFQLRRFIK